MLNLLYGVFGNAETSLLLDCQCFKNHVTALVSVSSLVQNIKLSAYMYIPGHGERLNSLCNVLAHSKLYSM